MIVLGIDPGTAIMGYGLIEFDKGKYKTLAYGVLRTSKDDKMENRLEQLYYGVNKIIDEFSPSVMAVEQLFFNTNQTTAITVGQARGIALLCASMKKLTLAEYTPLQVKQAVVGYGRAEKNQVQYMITKMLNLKEVPKPDDAADALAIALTYCMAGGNRAWRSTDGSVNARETEDMLLARSKDYKVFKPKKSESKS